MKAPGFIPEALIERAFDWLLVLQADPDDAEQKAQFDTWLRSDPLHEEAYRRAVSTWKLTGQVQASELHDGAAIRSLPGRRRSRVRWGIPAALAACLMLLAAWPSLSILLRADYRTDVGGMRTVSLADGSSVILNTDSALSVEYSGSVRALELIQGEAYFEVASDPARPFIVQAGDHRVTVLGTAFNVRHDDDGLSVAVVHGRVQSDRDGDSLELHPGDRLHRVPGSPPKVTEVNTQRIASWRKQRLAVAGATVAEVAAELDRYHLGRIWVLDEKLAERRVTGSYNLATPEAALHALVEPHGGRVQTLTPYVILLTAE